MKIQEKSGSSFILSKLFFCSLSFCIVLKTNQLTAQITLKEAYKDAFKIGVAVNDQIVSGKDKASQDIVVKHFNTITLDESGFDKSATWGF